MGTGASQGPHKVFSASFHWSCYNWLISEVSGQSYLPCHVVRDYTEGGEELQTRVVLAPGSSYA